MRKKISAVIIVKNEAARIGTCIEALGFCDEIIVVDNASDDSTALIAKKQNARVVSANSDNFSTLRNLGKEKATGHWILYVDADEIVSKELATEIVQAIEKKDKNSYTLTRKNYYLGTNWPQDEHMLRLFQADALIEWVGNLHESPKVIGAIGALQNSLIHDTHRSLAEMVSKTNQWSLVEAKLRFDAKHPPMSQWRFFRVMMTAFWDYFVRQRGYKAGLVGVIESMYQAFSMFITYAKLWELQQNKRV